MTPMAITIGPNVIGIRGPIRAPRAPPREARNSMQSVIGRVASPAASAPYPPTVWSWSTRKNRIAPSAAYTSRVITLAALKVRLAEHAEGQHRLPLAPLGHHEGDAPRSRRRPQPTAPAVRPTRSGRR